MPFVFDTQAINHMTVAVRAEMTVPNKRSDTGDTLFIGGTPVNDFDRTQLALFGMRKNYKIVYSSFGGADAFQGPTGIHVVVTDGLTQSTVLHGGRLWKRDPRSRAVLMFAGHGVVVFLDARGRMKVRRVPANPDAQGFETAREAVIRRAAAKPGGVPVLSPIGGLSTVLDIGALNDMLAQAA